MATPARIAPERLRQLLDYDPDTGIFRWRKRDGCAVPAGTIAGTLSKSGYRYIHVCGRSYRAHQLAWLYVKGIWARPTIDHRDLDKSNNRWSNLRRATRSENAANRRRPCHNASGFKGVYLHRKSGRWYARIRKDGRVHHMGSFLTAQDAHAAYAVKARELFGEFARTE